MGGGWGCGRQWGGAGVGGAEWHSPLRRGCLASPPPSGRAQPGKEPRTEKPPHTHVLINFYSWREREAHKHSGTQGPGRRAGEESEATCHEPGRRAARARFPGPSPLRARAVTHITPLNARRLLVRKPLLCSAAFAQEEAALTCQGHMLSRASGLQQDRLSLNTLSVSTLTARGDRMTYRIGNPWESCPQGCALLLPSSRLSEEASFAPTLSYILHSAPVIIKVVPWLSAIPLSLYRHIQSLDVAQGCRFGECFRRSRHSH